MKNLPIAELVLGLVVFGLLSVLGPLAGTQFPTYIQATTALGIHAFSVPLWYFVTVLFVIYGATGFVSSLLTTRFINELLCRSGL